MLSRMPPHVTSPVELAQRESYVLFTTFRRTGAPVSTPVWFAPLDADRACFTTADPSGKVKRLRHTPRVTLQACSARGVPHEGAPVIEARARVVREQAEVREVVRAIERGYGIQGRLLTLGGWLGRTLRVSKTALVGVVVEPVDPADSTDPA